MDKDINRIKVVLAEKGGGRETTKCLVEGTKEPKSAWQSSWGVTYYGIKMVYQRLPANDGNVSENCRTTECGTDRISKNKEKSNGTHPSF